MLGQLTSREPFTVAAADGWVLKGEVIAPPLARAVAIVGHAMMVSRRTLDRPHGRGLVSHLLGRGIAVVSVDLRGHGASGPRAEEGGLWDYDDLVADVPLLVSWTRARFPELPIAAVGHSLFGHVTLAALARAQAGGPALALERLVLLACNMPSPAWRRPAALARKLALIAPMVVVTRARGRFPTRALRLGTDDEAAPYMERFLVWLRTGEWQANDGFSYFAALGRVRTPVLALGGAGDHLLAPEAEARALVAPLPNASFERWGRARGLELDPGHMALALDERCRPVWDRAAEFVLA